MYRDGRGSYDSTIAGLRKLVAAGLEPGVIAVVTEELLPFAKEFHQLMVDEGVRRLGLNVEEIEGINRDSALLRPVNEAHWRDFVGSLYELSRRSGLRIREFDTVIGALLNRGSVTDDQSEPFAILSFDATGNISTFSPELLTYEAADGHRPFVFGNVFEVAVDGIVDSAKFVEVLEGIRRGNAKCREQCHYYDVCGGGAPANKMSETGRFDVSETRYCRFRRQLVADVLVEDLLKKSSSELRDLKQRL
jgi:uncharacterized protein